MIDYPYIRAWYRISGSFPYYIEQQVELARQENAPHDAVFRHLNQPIWYTVNQIGNKETKTAIIAEAQRISEADCDSP